MINRVEFFNYLEHEQTIMFLPGISQTQKSGIEIKLDVWEKWYALKHPLNYLAAALGQIYHETGGLMIPVIETFAPDRKISAKRLEKAFSEGRLKGVKQPYWHLDISGDHPVGCGDIQITHRKNYIEAEKNLRQKFGVDIKLSQNYDLALNPVISAHIAFSGMIDGWFRTHKLSDFETGNNLDYAGARNIVNGDADLMGEKIALYCSTFEKAFLVANKAQTLNPLQPDPPQPELIGKIDWPDL